MTNEIPDEIISENTSVREDLRNIGNGLMRLAGRAGTWLLGRSEQPGTRQVRVNDSGVTLTINENVQINPHPETRGSINFGTRLLGVDTLEAALNRPTLIPTRLRRVGDDGLIHRVTLYLSPDEYASLRAARDLGPGIIAPEALKYARARSQRIDTLTTIADPYRFNKNHERVLARQTIEVGRRVKTNITTFNYELTRRIAAGHFDKITSLYGIQESFISSENSL